MEHIPHELAMGDVYFSPLLAVVILSFFAAAITAILFNKLRLAQYIVYPSLSFLSMMVLFVVVIDHFLIKI
jgi:hypothetical protein